MKELLRQILKDAVLKAYPTETPDIVLDVPSNPQFGDYATNAALALGRRVKNKPQAVAQAILENIPSNDIIDCLSIAGPGFINIKLKPQKWIQGLAAIQEGGRHYGVSADFKGKKALVEFVSANPTGPLHIGHGRGAVVGDTIASLLQAVGYTVTREYYVNDGGFQMNTLGKSVYTRMRQLKGEDIPFPEGCYQGDYIRDIAKNILPKAAEFEGWDEEKIILHLGQIAGDTILEEIKLDLKNTGIEFDSYFFESTLYRDGKVDESLADLKAKEMSYEKDGALWLASTRFGDDKDRVLIKTDGSFTYLSPDIAYHRDKFKRGYDMLVNVWGADHAGYGPRLKAALQGLGYESDKIFIAFIQMVSLIKGGELLSMSTRRAQYETLENVVKAVGCDVARYFFMMRSYEAQLDFDLELATQQNSENPVYYIQYAHARICSIFAKAVEEGKAQNRWPTYRPDFSTLLQLPEEIDLTRFLLTYPDLIGEAARDIKPHRIAHYALELTRKFQSYYDKARGDDRYRALNGSPELIEARLFFFGSVRQVLQNALNILGVTAPEKM